MKETRNLWTLWKESVQWEQKTFKQKVIFVWFGISFTSLFICGESILLSVLATANFAASAYCLTKYVPIEE